MEAWVAQIPPSGAETVELAVWLQQKTGEVEWEEKEDEDSTLQKLDNWKYAVIFGGESLNVRNMLLLLAERQTGDTKGKLKFEVISRGGIGRSFRFMTYQDSEMRVNCHDFVPANIAAVPSSCHTIT